MEARVKERLTGAVVLIAIIVILVPEILSGPKRAPAPPPGSHTVTIDLTGPRRVATPAAPEPASVAPTDTGVVSARPDGTGVALVAPSTEVASGTSTSTQSGPPPATVAPAKDTPPATAAPRAAPAPRASGAPAQPEAVSGWVVQLGSFKSRDNAQKFVTELQHKGYTAFIAEFQAGDKVLYRVRVGPEQDRARADALRVRLGHEGYQGSVTPHP